ncbi:MAG: cytochrome c oxidase assembly protein [Desertimonas sp.]
MRWWCSQLYEPWTWVPKPYLGVWLIVVALVVTRSRRLRQHRSEQGVIGVTGRQRAAFWFGLFGLWLASDWPVGALGAGYLSSIHMAQYMLYTFLAAPMLLLAAPEWWVRSVLMRLRIRPLVRWLTHPVRAAILTNAILLATHSPWTVDHLRVTQIGSFLLDAVWFLGGLIVWYPVLSPIQAHRVASPPLRCVYLFIAAGVSSLIPAGFLTFAGNPLYRSYEIAPRVWLNPIDDQQLAGAIMKVGALPVIWITILMIWIRWSSASRAADQSYRRPRPVDTTAIGLRTRSAPGRVGRA